MLTIAVCPHHHQWDIPDNADPASQLQCPVCGETGKPSETLQTHAIGLPAAPPRPHEPPSPPASPSSTATILFGTAAHDAATVPQSDTERDRTSLAIPGFEILQELGVGGMGIVYQARDIDFNRIVALKMIRGGALAGAEALKRFRREGQAMAQFDHAHIVPILHHGEHLGQPFYTMKFMAGGSLQDRLEQVGADIPAAVAFMEKVARAVEYLHQKKILHRDLKPHNILLDESGEPHVSDFGLAKFLDPGHDQSHSRAGAVMGTWHFMAPEQAAAKSDQIGPPTDVWALGVILYQLLARRRPFEAASHDAVLKCILRAEPARPSKPRKDLDRDLEAIILKCLEKSPDRRYSSAGLLADDLAHWRRGEPILARPDSTSRRLVRAVRRHPGRSLAAALLFGALAGLAGGFAYPEIHALLNPPPIEAPLDPPLVLIDDQAPLVEPLWIKGNKNNPFAAMPLSPAAFTIPGTADDCFAFIELRPDVPWPRFRLEADVRIDQEFSDIPGLGYAGISIAHTRYTSPTAVCDAFLGLCVRARNVNGLHCAELQWMTVDSSGPEGFGRATFWSTLYFPAPEDWHRLVIEVSDDGLQPSWNDQPLPPASAAGITGSLEHLFPRDPAVAPRYEPQAGIALFAQNASASFRNVRIHPLR